MDNQLKGAYMSATPPTQSENAKVTTPTPPAPKFDASQPWHVTDFVVSDAKLVVKLKDSANCDREIEFDRERLALIRCISDGGDVNSDKYNLYAEVYVSPKRLFIQSARKVVYLGQIEQQHVSDYLDDKLRTRGLVWVWDLRPRDERTADLLPRTWGPQAG